MKTIFVLFVLIFSVASIRAQQAEYGWVLADSVQFGEPMVKGAPFSGESINETIQTLGDGNRIIRRSSSKLFRDGEGRYRREDMPKQIGLPGTAIDMPESISIIDPVGGFKYTLNPKTNTARKSPFRNVFEFKLKADLDYKLKTELYKTKIYAAQADAEKKAAGDAGSGQNQDAEAVARRLAERAKADAERSKQREARNEALQKQMQERLAQVATTVPRYAVSSKYETKKESLGTQNVEGVQAEGTRTTTTIPAGAVGNERPIEIVYERWYSKDLQMIIVSKHNDPRIGEQTYRLTNIVRGEPASSLFSPPADYKVIESGPKPAAVMLKAISPNAKAVALPSMSPTVKTVPAAPKPAVNVQPKDQ